MAKQIWDNFLGGYSYYDRNAPSNTYNEGRAIDPHRGLGYLKPGWSPTTITKSDDATPILVDLPMDMVIDPNDNDDIYFIGDTGTIYQVSSSASEKFNSGLSGSSYYYDISAGSIHTTGDKVAVYDVSGTSYLLYGFHTSAAGHVGNYDLSSTFNDNWLAADIGTGANVLQSAPVDMLEWQTYMWISHGRYVGRLDGANNTWDHDKLDLGEGWEVTKLFPAQNYIGICAWKKTGAATFRTESRVFLWDGVSPTYNKWIPVADNKINTAFNNNGEVVLVTYGRDFAPTISRLIETGSKKIRKLKVPIAGGTVYYGQLNPNTIDNFGNRVLFGAYGVDSDSGDDYLSVFSYGNEEDGQPLAITNPWDLSATDGNAEIGFLKTVNYNKVYVSHTTGGGVYYLSKFNGGNSTSAYWKGNYFDAGGKIRINYVKFYFKELVASDDVTPTLDLDYGTSFTLKDPRANTNISYTNDGAVTEKRFEVKEDCHAFRPVLNWTAGGVAFSKIVVDYDYISDN